MILQLDRLQLPTNKVCEKMDFKDWLVEAKTERIIVYHGTSPKLLPTIMSQGLIPNPKNRTWATDDNTGFSTASRQSLEGIYVSTNLMVALSSAGNGKHNLADGKLIIVAEIQPKTGFADEDNVNRLTYVADNEYIISALYGAIKQNPNQEFVQDEFKKYKDRAKSLVGQLNQVHPELQRRLDPLIWEMFIKATARQAAYVDPWTFRKSSDYYKGLEQPDKATVEREYLALKDKLTKTLKRMANPFNLDQSSQFLFTSRIMQPIKFSGPNRILAIVYEPRDYKAPPEVVYGTVPAKFIEDWRRSVGKWEPIYRT